MGNPLYYRFDEGGESISMARPLPVVSAAYPSDSTGTQAVAVRGSSGNVANATATASIPAVAGKTAYVAGFDITGSGATAASVVSPTLAGILGGTATYTLAVVAGATLGNQVLRVTFTPPFPASAVNTAITLSCPALGVGNTNNTANIYGFYL